MAGPIFRRFDDPTQFYALVAPALAAREVENNVLLGAARRVAERQKEAVLLAAVLNDGAPAVAALREPPHALVISTADADDVARLAAGLQEAGEPIPSVVSVGTVARRFAECWADRTGQDQRPLDVMILYTLAALIPPARPASGTLRAATADDAAWLTDWFLAFADEVGLPAAERGLAHNGPLVRKKIAEGRQFVWEDRGRPVAMVGFAPGGLDGARVAPVMTAPAERRKGYATAGVAALCRTLIDSRIGWCGVFADAAYPPSNRVYQRLGFVEACRYESIEFTPRGAP